MRFTSHFTFLLLAAGLSSSAFGATYIFNANNANGTSNVDVISDANGSSVTLTLDGYTAATALNSTEEAAGKTWTTGATVADKIVSSAGGYISMASPLSTTSFLQFAVATNVSQVTIYVKPDVYSTVGVDVWDSQTLASPGTWLGKYTATTSASSPNATAITFSITPSSQTQYITISESTLPPDCYPVITKIIETTSTPEPGTMTFSLLAGLALISPKIMKRFAKK